jgi:hypothetical protein
MAHELSHFGFSSSDRHNMIRQARLVMVVPAAKLPVIVKEVFEAVKEED